MNSKKLKISTIEISSFVTQLEKSEKETLAGGASAGCDSVGAGGSCVLNSRCCPTFNNINPLCWFAGGAAAAAPIEGVVAIIEA